VVRPTAQNPTRWLDGVGDWYTSGNWSAGVPNRSKYAQIDNGGAARISAVGATASHVFLGFNAPSNSGAVTVDGTGTLSATISIGVGVWGTGRLSITNGGAVSHRATLHRRRMYSWFASWLEWHGNSRRQRFNLHNRERASRGFFWHRHVKHH
jgi:T5SS/PEP-CTERM-associated repeat protein